MFWSSQTLKTRIAAEQLIVPYDEGRVVHAAYEMGVGSEAFVTSSSGEKTAVPAGTKIIVPPGQFGLIVTREIVRIPKDAIGFISIRAGIKFQGLVNVSGFHVDPGYNGQLKFAVYNAGSRNVVLDLDQRVFMLWFSGLDGIDEDPYRKRTPSSPLVSADDVSKMQGDVASPAELKKQLEELRVDLDKKFHASEQTRLFNRALIMLLIGMAITIIIALIKPYVEGRQARVPLAPASQVPASSPSR